MQFDHRGTIVSKSQPVTTLRKLTKILTIDSVDRDTSMFVRVNGGATTSDAGDYVVYLPRVYERITKITLKSATIQAPVLLSSSATTIGFQSTDTYILLGLEGLNRKDETAPGADRSGHVDTWFAKLPNDLGVPRSGFTLSSGSSSGTATTYTTPFAHGLLVGQTVCITGTTNALHNVAYVQIASVPTTTTFTIASTVANGQTSSGGTVFISGTLFFNESTYDHQYVEYSPPIGRLQRLHITLRRHLPPASIGTATPLGAPIVFGSSQNSFTFEIEYLDNGFDDFSSMQTRLTERPSS
ncbi:MAG: hypothetical protein EBY26_05460 [Microbacteriaceae bacterium]|nr:hypothetical protein [Microbacteriaceae bacterium]